MFRATSADLVEFCDHVAVMSLGRLLGLESDRFGPVRRRPEDVHRDGRASPVGSDEAGLAGPSEVTQRGGDARPGVSEPDVAQIEPAAQTACAGGCSCGSTIVSLLASVALGLFGLAAFAGIGQSIAHEDSGRLARRR